MTWLDEYFDTIDAPEETPPLVLPENARAVAIAPPSAAARIHVPQWLDDYFGPARVVRDGVVWPQKPELEFAGDGITVDQPADQRIRVTLSGTVGADGSTWRVGSGAPLDTLGADGDFYLDSDTGDVYVRASGAYTLAANLTGPQGADGAEGIPKHIASNGVTSTPDRDTLNFSAEFNVADDAINARKTVSLAAPAATAAALDGLLWTLPNLSSISSVLCRCPSACTVEAQMDGVIGQLYTVTLRVRGVVEVKSYVGGTRTGRLYHGGWKDPANVSGSAQNQIQNVYRLEIEDPSDYYWLNAWDGAEASANRCYAVDVTFAVQVYGGSWVRLAAFADYEYAADVPTGTGTDVAMEYRNVDGSGNPITVGGAGILVAEPYDGQWLQLNVLGVV